MRELIRKTLTEQQYKYEALKNIPLHSINQDQKGFIQVYEALKAADDILGG